MLPPDPDYLAEAVKVFLAQAQRRADQDPAAIKLHDQEISALREAVAALEGRLARGEACIAKLEELARAVQARQAGIETAHQGRLVGWGGGGVLPRTPRCGRLCL